MKFSHGLSDSAVENHKMSLEERDENLEEKIALKGTMIIKCELCDEEFTSKIILKQHVEIVHAIKTIQAELNRAFFCGLCNFSMASRKFTSESELEEHIQMFHSKNKKRKLEVEEKEYEDFDEMAEISGLWNLYGTLRC